MTVNIVILEPLHIPDTEMYRYVYALQSAGHTVTVYPDRPADTDTLCARVQNADILLFANMPFPAQAVEAARNAKLFVTAFTGVDHIAMDRCREYHIPVCNCSGYSDTAVAEMTIGLMLSVLRLIPLCDTDTRQGKNSRGKIGREINGKTVGVIGTGHIGTAVIRLLKAFGADVIAYSRTQKEDILKMGVTYVPLETLLKKSDIVTLHVPATPQTRHLIDETALRSMKKSAVLINCARGPVVDNHALAKVLNEGVIAGAGIDVFDTEPPLATDYPLLNAPNLVLTPHTAYFTQEAMERRAAIAFDNIRAFLNGTIQNEV